jgi:hypothetical protein
MWQGRGMQLGVRKQKYMYEIGPEVGKEGEESREKAGLRNIYYVSNMTPSVVFSRGTVNFSKP